MKLIEMYFQTVTINRFPPVDPEFEERPKLVALNKEVQRRFDALKVEGRWEVRATKPKDQVQLINIRGTGWNTYASEIDDDSFYIGDNGEGMEHLKGLGIDVESEGVKKEILSILEDQCLVLSEKGEIGHVITRDTWNRKEHVYLALIEIEDMGKLYMEYKRIFGNNKEVNK